MANLMKIQIGSYSYLIVTLEEAALLLALMEKNPLYIRDGYGKDAKYTISNDETPEIGFVTESQVEKPIDPLSVMVRKATT